MNKTQEALAEQPARQRPQNCGTGYCSCIECLFEHPPASKPWVGLTDETTQIVKRYNYMMHPDYFEVYDADSRHPYRVGIQPKVENGFGKSINECIQGRGATLEEALDRAIEAAHGIKGDA